MDEIFKPLLSGTTPSPPKFNVNVTWSALAPMDEKNQTPNITFSNTRAETLRFARGVQDSACCRVWIFCPSTVVVHGVHSRWSLEGEMPGSILKIPLWDLCRRSCARYPWQFLCASCCARSLCKAICARFLKEISTEDLCKRSQCKISGQALYKRSLSKISLFSSPGLCTRSL